MKALEQRVIPGTRVAVSRVGFGAARLFAGLERRQSRKLIEAALKLGIRHFDTAPSYAHGESEIVLGEVLAGQSDVSITSKVGIECPEQRPSVAGTAYRLLVRPVLSSLPSVKARLLRWRQGVNAPSLAPAPAPPRVLSRDAVLRNLEHSLRRLRRDRIDLYLVHEPDQYVLDDALAQCFAELQQQGVIGAWGLGYGRKAADAPHFGQVLQCAAGATMPSDRFILLHGVLRDPQTHHQPAARRLAEALHAYPNAALLFSASSTHAMADIAKALP